MTNSRITLTHNQTTYENKERENDAPVIKYLTRVLFHLDTPILCTLEQVNPRLEDRRRGCGRQRCIERFAIDNCGIRANYVEELGNHRRRCFSCGRWERVTSQWTWSGVGAADYCREWDIPDNKAVKGTFAGMGLPLKLEKSPGVLSHV